MSTQAERLKQARLEKGLSQQELADKAGVSQSTIGNIESGIRKFGLSAHAIADALGVSMRWLTEEVGEKVKADQPKEQVAASTLQPILAWEHESDLPQGEYVFIPRLDIHLSAGNGREQVEFDFVKKQPQAFRADWITEQRLNPSKLACLKVDGESMEPLLYHGETVVIDVSQNTVRDSKVYAIWYDGGERIKRLWKLPGGGLRIKSDNPQHDTIEVAPEHAESVRVIGRVVHKSGTGGL